VTPATATREGEEARDRLVSGERLRSASYQKSERRAARPSASMVAIRAFTCSTFSPITSSSSLGFPVKRIGSPK